MMNLNCLRLAYTIRLMPSSLLASLKSIIISTRLVFSRWPYLASAGAVTAIFWIIFNLFDQLLFFSPVVTFYLPDDAMGGFILSSITASLVSAVISMNVYVIRHSNAGFRCRSESFL